MTRAFASHVRVRKAAEFGLDERHETFESGLVAVAPGLQQPGDVLWGSHEDGLPSECAAIREPTGGVTRSTTDFRITTREDLIM
jgi:hypothetical protein